MKFLPQYSLPDIPASERGPKRVPALAVFAGLALFTLLINYPALSVNWRWDDPSILLHLHQFSRLHDFIRPEVWQQFSPASLTPWLALSYEIDLRLFGLRPVFFYGHQLLALAGVGFVFYRCLGLWIAWPYALLGAILFLSSAPSLLSAQQLMTRHYVEGGLFALLALYGFVRHLRAPSRLFLWGSLGCYVLAVTAKEVYVPLAVLLPFLPEANLRKRLTAAAPYVVVVIAYALWRGYMLNSVAGGYVGSSEILDATFLGELLTGYARFPELLFGAAWPVALAVLVALMGTYGILRPAVLPFALVLAALSLLPLAPLTRFPGITVADRYLFVVVLVLSGLVTVCVERLMRLALGRGQRLLATGLIASVAVVVSLSILQGRAVRDVILPGAREFDTQTRFIWEQDNRSAFFPSAILLPSYWFVVDLITLKTMVLPGATAPVAIPDVIYLNPDVDDVYEYVPACDCMETGVQSVEALLAEHAARRRSDAALALEFRYEANYFSWQFGPYTEGEYHVVSDVLGVTPAPRSGSLRVTLDGGTPFYLRYTSPEGWITYSSLQIIHLNAPTTTWNRE